VGVIGKTPKLFMVSSNRDCSLICLVWFDELPLEDKRATPDSTCQVDPIESSGDVHEDNNKYPSDHTALNEQFLKRAEEKETDKEDLQYI
jgi:hypothetical protein